MYIYSDLDEHTIKRARVRNNIRFLSMFTILFNSINKLQ